MNHPFAVEVYDRFLKGESIRQLADELQIPADRVEQRLRAAALYLARWNCLHTTAITTAILDERAG